MVLVLVEMEGFIMEHHIYGRQQVEETELVVEEEAEPTNKIQIILRVVAVQA